MCISTGEVKEEKEALKNRKSAKPQFKKLYFPRRVAGGFYSLLPPSTSSFIAFQVGEKPPGSREPDLQMLALAAAVLALQSSLVTLKDVFYYPRFGARLEISGGLCGSKGTFARSFSLLIKPGTIVFPVIRDSPPTEQELCFNGTGTK